jgi:hypothetical protein
MQPGEGKPPRSRPTIGRRREMTRAERISRDLQRLNKAQQERDAKEAAEEKARVAAALTRMQAKP